MVPVRRVENKNGRLSRDSHSHINLISIMKNNFYSFVLASTIALLEREQSAG